jgi:hypothetical protein
VLTSQRKSPSTSSRCSPKASPSSHWSHNLHHTFQPSARMRDGNLAIQHDAMFSQPTPDLPPCTFSGSFQLPPPLIVPFPTAYSLACLYCLLSVFLLLSSNDGRTRRTFHFLFNSSGKRVAFWTLETGFVELQPITRDDNSRTVNEVPTPQRVYGLCQGQSRNRKCQDGSL